MAGDASRRNGLKGGKPKGHRSKATLDKIAARELVRQTVTAALVPLLEAQIANAQGIKYLIARNKTSGKFIRVGEAAARVLQGSEEEIIEVWEKDPSVQAFTDLMNRCIDKPQEQEQKFSLVLDAELRARLADGRQRNAARKKLPPAQ